jgi:hypothetical protein
MVLADNNTEPRGAKRRLADAIPTRSIIAITVGFETLQFEVFKTAFPPPVPRHYQRGRFMEL